MKSLGRALFALVLLAAASGSAGAQTAATPMDLPIAGRWTGNDWGDVVIAADGTGSYSATFGTGPGRLQLQRVDADRYQGTWRESDRRFGRLVLVLSHDRRTLTGTFGTKARHGGTSSRVHTPP